MLGVTVRRMRVPPGGELRTSPTPWKAHGNRACRRGRLDSARCGNSHRFTTVERSLTQGEHQADHHRPPVDRCGPAGRGHRPCSRRGRRTESRKRPPGHGDEPRACRLHPLPEGDAARPRGRRVDRPRPVRPLRRALQPDPLHPALPGRLRPGAGRPQGLPHLGSKTPGHPEYGHTTGVETTTGPLGQGVANAVGMAMAARYERGLFDPEAAPGTSPFDHMVWVIAGDGCLQEGISAEASSLAGHQKLGNLVLLWDDNHISIEATRGPRSPRTPSSGTRRTAGTCSASTSCPAATSTRRGCTRAAGGQGRDRAPLVHRGPLDHRLARPERAEHRGRARLGARRRRGRGDQAGPRLRPGAGLRGLRRGHRPHPRGPGPRSRGPHRVGQGVRRVAHGQPGARRLVRPDLRGRAARGLGGEAPVFEPGKSLATRAASGKVLQALGETVPELWAAPPTWPARTTPRSTRRRRSSPRATRCRRPTRTAGRSTSASASTPWPPP